MQKLAPSLPVSLPPLEAESLTHQQILGPTVFLFVFRIIIWTKKAPVVVGFAITRMELWVLSPSRPQVGGGEDDRATSGHVVSTHTPCRVYTESHRCELVSRTRSGQHSLLLYLGRTASRLCHLRFLSNNASHVTAKRLLSKPELASWSNTKADWKIPTLP